MRKEQLLALVQEGFQNPAWHGPNLKNALRGVSAEEAAWRPVRGRHNIWEIVLHAAYWKYIVARRLTGSRKHDFPEKGRNWFVRDGATRTIRWQSDLALLARMHQELLEAIAGLKGPDLARSTRGDRRTAMRDIVGIAMHDVYHAGQIQLLRKLYGSRKR